MDKEEVLKKLPEAIKVLNEVVEIVEDKWEFDSLQFCGDQHRSRNLYCGKSPHINGQHMGIDSEDRIFVWMK